jgi:hypothetical protein
MKNNKLLNTFALTLLLLPGWALGQRNTIWLDGVRTTTSKGWQGTPNAMRDFYNYDFVDLVSTNSSGSQEYDVILGVRDSDMPTSPTAAMQMEPMLDNRSNVLGIAHDFGGLVLRELANRDNSLSAMILDGVPNQGSSAVKLATDADNLVDKTSAQLILENAQSVQAMQDCDDCNALGIFETWINALSTTSIDVFDQMANESSQITYLNDNPPPPEIPFAILWGSVEELSLMSLMDSRTSNNPWSTPITTCAAEAMERARKDYETDLEILGLISTVSGFFGRALSAFGEIAGDIAGGETPSPGTVLSAFGDWVVAERSAIIEDIEAQREADQELARILRCELSHQLLASEWQFGLIKYGTVEVGTEEVPLLPEASQALCIQYCQEQFTGFPGLSVFGNCVEDCMDDLPTQTVTVYLPEENDGLLLKSEQMLDGAAFVYHLEEHNHFQETALSGQPSEGTLNHALQELFDGTAGPAFAVPKQ